MDNTTTTENAPQWDHIDFYIADVYVSALIYSDETALDTRESRLVDAFERDNKREGGHWEVIPYADTFARCEVTGLMADCAKLRLNFPEAVH